MKNLFLVLDLLLICCSLYSAPVPVGGVAGTIIDAETAEPLPYTNVFLQIQHSETLPIQRENFFFNVFLQVRISLSYRGLVMSYLLKMLLFDRKRWSS